VVLSVLSASLSLSPSVSAMDDSHFQDAFNAGIQAASDNKNQAVDAMRSGQAEQAVNHFTDHPKETDYVKRPDDIKQAGLNARANDPLSRGIEEGIEIREKNYHWDVDPDSPELNNITDRAGEWFKALEGKFGDCVRHQSCSTTYTTETCVESPKSFQRYCHRILNIDFKPEQTVTHYPLKIHLSTREHTYAGVSVNAVTGQAGFIGPRDARFVMEGRLPVGVDCHALQGRILPIASRTGIQDQDYINIPSCQNGLTLDFHFTSRARDTIDLDMVIDMTLTQIVQHPVDHWNDECLGLSNQSQCRLQTQNCLEGPTTHDLQGNPIRRECWDWENSYLCGGSIPSTQCDVLRLKGCEQIGSVCQESRDGVCSQFQQSLRCPTRSCIDDGEICDGKTYCLDGDCVHQQKQADPDFEKAVSALLAVHDAGKSFSEINTIFEGRQKSCDNTAIGYLDCCADSGWGKDLFSKCTQEEKDLLEDKKNHLVVYVGEYCKKTPLGVCVEKRKSYCVFPSKIAKIIQEQGRRGQQGISFGRADQPDCRGMTREEFSEIRLQDIDFSDFYVDIENKKTIEKIDMTSKRIEESTQKLRERPHL